MGRFLPPGGLTVEHTAAIGHMATTWSGLENQCQILLWQIAGLESRKGRCITQHISFRALWDSVFSLLAEVGADPKEIDAAKSIYQRTDKLRISRNNYIHAVWAVTPESMNASAGEATSINFKARGELKIDQRNVHYDEINSLTQDIYSMSLEIAEFGKELEGKYSASEP